MATAETRKRPNILITGAPGTGKTTLSQQVAEKLGFEHVNVSETVRVNELYSEYDDTYQCHVMDEDKFLDFIEERMDSEEGGVVMDYHGCDFFPERWFDYVFVLRCDNTVLFDRLTERGYAERKKRENVECEIFGTLLEEAKESYPDEVVHELQSSSLEQMETNLEGIVTLVSKWRQNSYTGE